MLNKIRNWIIRDDAVAAIEFALVGLPFIIMLIGFIEISLFFATAVSLEDATNDVARLIRTGQVSAASDPLVYFTTALCNDVSGLIQCAKLQYEVEPIPSNSFANASTLQPEFDQNGNLISPPFNIGVSSGDVLVRVVYPYTFLTPFLGNIITGSVSSTATLMSTIVIENEPYTFGG